MSDTCLCSQLENYFSFKKEGMSGSGETLVGGGDGSVLCEQLSHSGQRLGVKGS